MEERLAELERRVGAWEVTRARAQRRGTFWYIVLTLVVFASPFLTTSPEEEGQPKQAQAASFPRLHFGRLRYLIRRGRGPCRSAASSRHSQGNRRP